MRDGTVLIGRSRELSALTDAVRGAANGRAAVVLLAGDAGVGKSRLLAELVDGLESDSGPGGMRALVGHCVNLPDGGVPYLPLIDALRRLDSDSWRRLEPHLRGTTEAPLSRLQIYDAVVELLFALAEEQPLCLVLEDMHWSDRSSRDLLRYLFGQLGAERLLVVLTYRSDDVDRRHPLRPFLADLVRLPVVSRVVIDPLPAEGIEELVLTEGALDPVMVADIVARADGNAFFAEELRDAALAGGGGSSDDGLLRRASAFGSGDALPDALLDVLIARLEQLDRRAASVVGVAAVAGRRVGHEVLAAVTGLSEGDLEDALRDAVARHILVPGADTPAYEFRHALMQEAAYAELLPGERVRLHRAYAQVLTAQLADNASVAAELAYHAELSHDLPLALSASVQAARHARAVHAPYQAQCHFEQAMLWWCAVPDAAERVGISEVDLHLLAADAARAAGDPARAAILLQAAYDLVTGEEPAGGVPHDPELRVSILSSLAAARYHSGDDRALDTSRAAAELAETLDLCPARAEARSTRAVILFWADAAGGGEMAALALADAEALGSPNLQAEALVTLARMSQQHGEADAAEAYFTRAIALARDSQDAATELRTLFNLAVSRADLGDLEQALRWTTQCLERASATGMTGFEYAKAVHGIDYSLRYLLGQWDGIAAADASRAPAAVRVSRTLAIAHIAVARGQADASEWTRELRETRGLGSRAHSQVDVVASIAQIEMLGWSGDNEAALGEFRTATRLALTRCGADFEERVWLAAVGLAAWADRAEQARLRGDIGAEADAVAAGTAVIDELRTALAEPAPGKAALGAETEAWRVRAEAEFARLRGLRDAEPWRLALQAFSFGYRYEEARCRYRLAEVLIGIARGGTVDSQAANDGADNESEATSLLQAARRDATDLGAAPLVAQIDALARRAKIAGVGAAVTSALLTARESEVLAALALGRTNKQIGAELFISEKTASVHVSNLLAKLGAATRGEAVAIARRRGLL